MKAWAKKLLQRLILWVGVGMVAWILLPIPTLFSPMFSPMFLPIPSAMAQVSPVSLRVGLTGKYPPFNYTDSNGQLAGFDVDIARMICREIGRRCDFKVLQWDGMISALLAGKIDAVIGSMAVTPERSQQVAFTQNYYESGAQLLVKPGTVEPHRIGVTLGTTYGEFATQKFKNAEVLTYKGDVEVLKDIDAGRLDSIITDRLVGLYMAKRFGVAIEPKGDLLYREKIAIPVRKDDTKLLQQINGALKRIKGSVEYRDAFEYYFGKDAMAEKASSFEWGKAVPLLLHALVNTVEVSFVGLAGGFLLAILLAALSLSSGMFRGGTGVERVVSFATDFIRATPFLVQLFLIYFGFPTIGIRMGAWAASILAIAIHSSAYLTEILQVSYRSIPTGQHQAAFMLGMTPWQKLRHVVWPQMLPILLPPSLNSVVAMIKDSAMVSVISVHELTLQAQQLISSSFRPMELYLAATVLYFLVTYPFLLGGRRLQRRFQREGLLRG